MGLWRISRFASLTGEGGRLYAGRWHTAGAPIVYLAASPAGALIEILVHLELDKAELPPDYTLLRITIPPRVRTKRLKLPASAAWKNDLPLTRKLGDAWLRSQRSALARVPSVILPDTVNYLLNPLHPDAARLTIADAQPITLDARLLR